MLRTWESILDYEKSEKYRAEIIKHGGYVFCSPACILVLNVILGVIEFNFAFITSTLVSAGLLVAGIYMVNKSYKIIYNIDRKRSDLNNGDE